MIIIMVIFVIAIIIIIGILIIITLMIRYLMWTSPSTDWRTRTSNQTRNYILSLSASLGEIIIIMVIVVLIMVIILCRKAIIIVFKPDSELYLESLGIIGWDHHHHGHRRVDHGHHHHQARLRVISLCEISDCQHSRNSLHGILINIHILITLMIMIIIVVIRSVPAAWLIFTLIVLLIYLLTRSYHCLHHDRRVIIFILINDNSWSWWCWKDGIVIL